MTRVLLVEDNPADAELARDCLQGFDAELEVEVLADGHAALDRLSALDPPPRLMLLDLNLPKIDGREVLRRVRADVRLRMLPVVVLSSSAADEDVRGAYEGGANAYLVKSMELDGVRRALRAVTDCFLRAASPPPW